MTAIMAAAAHLHAHGTGRLALGLAVIAAIIFLRLGKGSK